ncbi:F-box domain-containing protein [Mycena kentingensis (nom. inval.)]|nr:F-box domain-containing protein [Mycena kentingensis (nom. inval.)]
MDAPDTQRLRVLAIDAELGQLYARISALTAERNSMHALNRLPNELFARIFWYLPGLPSDAVMFVCRRWHTISVGLPELWSTIEMDTWDAATLVNALKRSGSRKLDIRIKSLGKGPEAEQALGILLENAARTVSLHVSGPAVEMDEFALRMQSVQFSTLTTLLLERDGKEMNLDDLWSTREPEDDKPEEVDLSGMTSLCSLSLLGACANFENFKVLLPTLTCLRLAHETPRKVVQLLPFLCFTPNLRSLIINQAIQRNYRSNTQLPVVALPALEFLEIVNIEHVDTLLLLGHLQIPPTARLHVFPHFYNTEDIPPIVAAVTMHAGAPGAPTAQKLLLGNRMPVRSGILRESHLFVETFTADEPLTAFWSFKADRVYSPAPETRVVDSILRALAPQHLTTVTHVHVSGCRVTAAAWKVLFADGILDAGALRCIDITLDEDSTADSKRFLQAYAQAKRFGALETVTVEIGPETPASVVKDLAKLVADLAGAYKKAKGAGKKLPAVHVRNNILKQSGKKSEPEDDDENEDNEDGAVWERVRGLVSTFTSESVCLA